MKTARDIAQHVNSGGSAVEVVRDALNRIQADASNAFRETFDESALAAAADIDRRIAGGEAGGPLAGVPVAIKDNICTTQGRTSCGSKMLEDYCSPFDATVVTRLQEAGAVVVGKVVVQQHTIGAPFLEPRHPFAAAGRRFNRARPQLFTKTAQHLGVFRAVVDY